LKDKTTSAVAEKYSFIIDYFQKNNPNAASELHFANAYELLLAVVLSAQCTDKRINMITPDLFAKYSTPFQLAKASYEEVFAMIKSVSYPNNKTKHLIGLAQKLVVDFKGVVPDNLEALITLPGVGRKTANVILSVVFDKPAMAVDTHVFRVANRLGIVKNATTPLAVEQQLVYHIPDHLQARAHHWLILHGRYVCLARAPKCDECGIASVCEMKNQKSQSLVFIPTSDQPNNSSSRRATSSLTFFFSFIFAFLFLFTSCIQKPEVPVPKPKGYFRLATPEVAYQRWDSVLPFTFDYSKHATLSFQKKENHVFWIDIYYPSLSAIFKMTYFPVQNNLHHFMWSEEEQVMFHVERMMTDDIQFSAVNDPKARVFGRIYELEGEKVATPFKFWLTDSSRHFVKSTLYFDFVPNNDSLAPIINYLKKDAWMMIDSWQWNK
jgi:endonuclease-3